MKILADILSWELYKTDFYQTNVGTWRIKGDSHFECNTEQLILKFIRYKLKQPTMKASEAKHLAETALASENDMADVQKVIKAAASTGKMKTFYYKNLTDLQQKTLKDDGYKVENQTDRDGTMYLIQW